MDRQLAFSAGEHLPLIRVCTRASAHARMRFARVHHASLDGAGEERFEEMV